MLLKYQTAPPAALSLVELINIVIKQYTKIATYEADSIYLLHYDNNSSFFILIHHTRR